MAEISESALTLRFFGDDLNPVEITNMLGHEPDSAFKKGEIKHGKEGRQYPQKTGSWRLKASKSVPANLDQQALEIFQKLTDNLVIWRDLSSRHRADLFVGLFMEEGNEMTGLSAETIKMTAERGLEIEFDIYDGYDD